MAILFSIAKNLPVISENNQKLHKYISSTYHRADSRFPYGRYRKVLDKSDDESSHPAAAYTDPRAQSLKIFSFYCYRERESTEY